MSKFSVSKSRYEEGHRSGVHKRSRQDVTSSSESEHFSPSESEHSSPVEEEPIMMPVTRRVTEDKDNISNRGIINRRHPGPISVTLLDPGILDCSICSEPLAAPIFQCDNGHMACSICCTRVKNKCPSCSLLIGYNRNRAIEKVVESVKIACRYAEYGCAKIVSYSAISTHEDDCSYLPCECPFAACSFMGSSLELYKHVPLEHKKNDIDGYRAISYDTRTPVSCPMFERTIILREETDGVIFVLNNESGVGGARKVALTRVASPDDGEYPYAIVVKSSEYVLKFESDAQNFPNLEWSTLNKYVLISPDSCFYPPEQLNLEVLLFLAYLYGARKRLLKEKSEKESLVDMVSRR